MLCAPMWALHALCLDTGESLVKALRQAIMAAQTALASLPSTRASGREGAFLPRKSDCALASQTEARRSQQPRLFPRAVG